jgi:hypothetical protein
MGSIVASGGVVALAVLAGCAAMGYEATGQQVRLWGSNEVPPVQTQAYGTGVVNIAADRSVTVTLAPGSRKRSTRRTRPAIST